MTGFQLPIAFVLSVFVALPGRSLLQKTTFCDDLNVVLDAARSDFQGIRGPKLPYGRELFESRFKLPNVTDCNLDFANGRSRFSCSWDVDDTSVRDRQFV